MRDFKKLSVWAKAHELTLLVYRSTSSFPANEMYGLTSQTRRAAASIGANIAEGCGREGDVDLARYLQIAMGSANELENHLLLARDLGFMAQDAYVATLESLGEVKRMLTGLLNRLRSIHHEARSSKLEANS